MYTVDCHLGPKIQHLGGDSQNFLHNFVRFFVTLGLKILRLFRLKVLYEADIIERRCQLL